MKVDFGFKKDIFSFLGTYAEQAGFILFILTFWMPWGFFLGGDPTFLGPYKPELEIIFSISGLGIFLVFFGRFFSQKGRNLSQKEILFLLSFLGFLAVASLFSLSPEHSLLFFIVWATGFLVMSAGESFFIQGTRKRRLLAGSILAGIVCQKFLFPAWDISSDILGIASLLGIVFLLLESPFATRPLYMLFFTWGVFASGNMALILLALLFFMTLRLWLPPSRHIVRGRDVLWSIIFLVSLLLWGWWTGMTEPFVFHWGLSLSFFQEFDTLLFGAGEGQFLPALAHISDAFLLPSDLNLPSSAFLLALSEKGFGGLFFLFLLFLSPILFFEERTKKAILIVLFLFFLVSSDALARENGILFFLVFLFAQQKRKISLQHRKK